MSHTEIQWFEEWFNSPYYHLLYGNRDEAEASKFIDQLLDRIGLESGSRALDLACGIGRHSKHISSKGLNVTGIDLSEYSISIAKELESESLQFFVHDMRQLFWKEHFELALNLFTSFGYFHSREDDLKMMNGVFDALKNHGLFVIDFMNTKKVVKNLVDYEEKTLDGVQFIIDRKVENNIIEKSIKIIDGNRQSQFVEEVDELYLGDFEELLEVSGFELRSTFGNYELAAFDEQNSDRLIIIAEKGK